MSQEGIEIHFDEQRGYLELACEPDAFAACRQVARKHLEDFPEIALDKVIEINITDTATFVARRDAPKRRIGALLFKVVVAVIIVLAIIGACALVTKPSPNTECQRTPSAVTGCASNYRYLSAYRHSLRLLRASLTCFR